MIIINGYAFVNYMVNIHCVKELCIHMTNIRKIMDHVANNINHHKVYLFITL